MQRIARSIVVAAVLLGIVAPSAGAADFINTFDADVFTDSTHTHVATQAGSTP